MTTQMRHVAFQLLRAWPALALVCLISGCGSDPYGVSQVTGLVTMDGAPLPSATVSFHPVSGRPAKGVTDQDGRYELIYIRDVRGAEPGSYTVRITTFREVAPDPVPGRVPPEPIPVRYNRRSMLTAEVEAGDNEINFDLTSAKR